MRSVEMTVVRLVHLMAAVLWPIAAALGLWRVRALHRRRTRMRVYLMMALGIVIGMNSAVMASSDRHPRSVLHLVAIIVVALMGFVVLYLVSAYGDELAHEERVLFAMSRGHLGDGHGRLDPEHPLSAREVEVIGCLCRGLSSE